MMLMLLLMPDADAAFAGYAMMLPPPRRAARLDTSRYMQSCRRERAICVRRDAEDESGTTDI